MADKKKIGESLHDYGLKPKKGVDAIVYGLEVLQKEVDRLREKIKQLGFKAERAAARSDLKTLSEIEDEINKRKVELEAAEKKFADRCKQEGLV